MPDTRPGLKRTRTVCPFCRFGCELEIVADGRRIVGVEYPAGAGLNHGRLCPRGSAAGLLLDHPQRLSYPLKDGRERTWPEFVAEARDAVGNCPSNEAAITFGANLTQEELGSIFGLANALGTNNVASSDIESEGFYRAQLDVKWSARAGSPFNPSLADITQAATILTVGDVFGVTPLLARPVLDARYADRAHRLFAIDSVKTRTAAFADRFLSVPPGREGLVLLALAACADARVAGFDAAAVAASCGIAEADLRQVGRALAESRKTLVIGATAPGRIPDARFYALSLQFLVSKLKGGRKLLMVSETATPAGLRPLAAVLAELNAGRIRVHLDFGGELEAPGKPGFRAVTAVLRPRHAVPGWVLPVPLNLEKSGTAATLWGTAALHAAASPASGAHPVDRIIADIMNGPVAPEPPVAAPLPAIASKVITDQGRALLRGVEAEAPEFRFTLLAEKPAYGWLDVFTPDDPGVRLSPADARELDLAAGGRVKVQTAAGQTATLPAVASELVRPGTALVDFNRPEIRALFELAIDNTAGLVTIPPVQAKLWRSE